jgi:molybdate transport system ATP-binding protein
VTAAVHPWDVALAPEPVPRVSIQNQLRGVVSRCTLHERSAIVEIDVGVPLIAEVSRKSAMSLELAAGRPIVCLMKSHAIRTIE